MRFEWDAPDTDETSPPIVGYRLEWGSASGVFVSSVNVGTALTHTLDLTNNATFYVVAKSVSATGLYSGASNEVRVAVSCTGDRRVPPVILGVVVVVVVSE